MFSFFKNKTRKKAFTLVEILIVIAVVGILFIVISSKIDFTTNKTKVSGVQTDFRAYQSSLHSVGIEHQGFTNDVERLATQMNKSLDPKLAVYVESHSLKTKAEDPWGETYYLMYLSPAESRGAVEVRSSGPDLVPYTTDDITTVITYQLTDEGGEVIVKNYGAGNNWNTESDLSLIASTGGMMDSSGTRVVYTWKELIREGIIDASGKVVPGRENDISGIMVLPEGMTVLPIEAFKGCTNLTGVDIPDSMTQLAGGTFWGCTNLKNVQIPDSVTFVGNYTFRDCTSITSVDFPSGVTYMNPHVLEGCSNVTSVSIPEGVTVLDCSAFKGNASLVSISLPSSLEVVWNFAFLDCTSLRSIYYDGTMAQWNGLTFGTEWSSGTSGLSVVCSDGSIVIS